MPYISHTIASQHLLPVALFTGCQADEGHNLFTVRYRFTQDNADGDIVELLALTRNGDSFLTALNSDIVERIEDFIFNYIKG